MRQYKRREGYPIGFTFADVLTWMAALWMDGLGVIELDRKGVQMRGGFYSDRD